MKIFYNSYNPAEKRMILELGRNTKEMKEF